MTTVTQMTTVSKLTTKQVEVKLMTPKEINDLLCGNISYSVRNQIASSDPLLQLVLDIRCVNLELVERAVNKAMSYSKVCSTSQLELASKYAEKLCFDFRNESADLHFYSDRDLKRRALSDISEFFQKC